MPLFAATNLFISSCNALPTFRNMGAMFVVAVVIGVIAVALTIFFATKTIIEKKADKRAEITLIDIENERAENETIERKKQREEKAMQEKQEAMLKAIENIEQKTEKVEEVESSVKVGNNSDNI